MIALIDGDVLTHRAAWGVETLQEAKKRFNEQFERTLEGAFAKGWAMAIGSPENFRNYLFEDYKRSKSRLRSNDTKESWFPDLKAYACGPKFPGSTLCVGYEADDILRVWHYECERTNTPSIVCSIDKDLDCIPGPHYNMTKDTRYNVSEEYAERFYWYQMITGDTVDNIPGVVGVGPVGANKALEPYNDRHGYKKAVCKLYHEKHGEEGFDRLLLNGKLLHIWRYIDDHFVMYRDEYDRLVHEE